MSKNKKNRNKIIHSLVTKVFFYTCDIFTISVENLFGFINPCFKDDNFKDYVDLTTHSIQSNSETLVRENSIIRICNVENISHNENISDNNDIEHNKYNENIVNIENNENNENIEHNENVEHNKHNENIKANKVYCIDDEYDIITN